MNATFYNKRELADVIGILRMGFFFLDILVNSSQLYGFLKVNSLPFWMGPRD